MALPLAHRFRDFNATTYCTSIGTSPAACYMRAPFRGTVIEVAACTQAAITVADCTVAFALNGTANTAGNLTIPVAGAAAGQIASAIPSSPIYVNKDDLVTLTPSGASAASIACIFTVGFRDTQ